MTKTPLQIHHDPNAPEVFDTIIIGAGPAGMTAAIYAARRKMKTLLICGDIGGQLRWCSDIENWTGVVKSTGPDLVQEFFDHVRHVDDENDVFDLWVHQDEKVTECIEMGGGFTVKTDKEQEYRTRTIILSTGKKPRTLGIPGEDIAMKGNGLSFSATSDAPLYKDKKMVVMGGGNSGMDVAIQLSKLTDDITLMTNLDHLIGEACLMHNVKENPAIDIKYNVGAEEILLDENQKVCGVQITENGGDAFVFDCEGIFEEVGQVPATTFLREFITLNDHNEIVTDRMCRTSRPGVFAGGDCNDGKYKQVVVAAGEGAVCALGAHEYIISQSCSL